MPIHQVAGSIAAKLAVNRQFMPFMMFMAGHQRAAVVKYTIETWQLSVLFSYTTSITLHHSLSVALQCARRQVAAVP